MSRLTPHDAALHYCDGSHRWLGVEPHDGLVRAHQLAHQSALGVEPVARSPRDTAAAGYDNDPITWLHDGQLRRAS